MKLTKPLQRVLSEIEESERGFLDLDAQQLLAHHLQQALCPPQDPYSPLKSLREGLYAGCTEDQWTLYKFSFSDLQGINAWAAYRRIRHDSPLKYAVPIALSARAEWMQAKINWKYHFDELWRPVLMAAATHDHLAIDRLLARWDSRHGKPNNRAYAAICLGVEALIRRDPRKLAEAVDEAGRRKTAAYGQGVNMALAGVAAADADLFARGLEQMLRRFKGYMYGDAVLSLIDPLSHGLFELAGSYAPECVAGFDLERKLPWDAEYSQWIASVDDIGVELAQLDMPGFLRRALIDMEDLDWAPDNRPQG